MSSLDGLSKKPSLVIFDVSLKSARRILASDEWKGFKISFYNKQSQYSAILNSKSYVASEDVNQNSGEVTVLCGESLRNGLAKYPYRSKYVYFHINIFKIAFYLGLIGLVRRWLIGQIHENNRISVLGLRKMTRLSFRYFLVLKNPNSRYTNHFSINTEIGYRVVRLLRNQDINMLIRFFENLPNRFRAGDDMDILVDDDLFNKAAAYLSENPGEDMVDMYSVTGPSNAAKIPYYTPYLAKKILANSRIYNGYKVPSREDYLFSFIYHCLYHKGISSGIPSKYKSLKIAKNPDNDYMAKITELAGQNGYTVGASLEELDDFMKSVKWRPHLDTLELLASNNIWLEKHIENTDLGKELCMVVCVLKKGFFIHNNVSDFERELYKNELFILKREVLEGERLSIAYNHLRGGNWSATNEEEFSPSAIYVLVDVSNVARLIRKLGLV